MSIGKAIRILRAARGLNKTEMADAAGCDASYLSLIEAGKREPKLSTLRQIADGLRVPEHLLHLLASGDEDFAAMPADQRDALARRLLDVVMEPEG